MPERTTGKTQMNADRLLLGGRHPVLAAAALFAAFMFAALPFVVDTDNPLVVAPSVIACASCSILFMRLLIGALGIINWFLLGAAGYLCIVAGPEWYVVALLTGGTVLTLFVIDRLTGKFVPLIDVSEIRTSIDSGRKMGAGK